MPKSPASSWLIVILVATTAVACAGLQLVHFATPPINDRRATLADYFPTTMSGWRSEERPLAGTEAVAEEVERILRYDDYVCRSYQKGSSEFTLYVAYWKPGKMPSREIAFHIPDKCWLTAGWKRAEATYDYRLPMSEMQIGPGQLRVFQSTNAKQHVLYWHIFSGQIIVYNRDGSPSDWTLFTDLFRLGLKLKGEQYFIRISSAHPLETLVEDDGFRQILELLAPLGVGLSDQVVTF